MTLFTQLNPMRPTLAALPSCMRLQGTHPRWWPICFQAG